MIFLQIEKMTADATIGGLDVAVPSSTWGVGDAQSASVVEHLELERVRLAVTAEALPHDETPEALSEQADTDGLADGDSLGGSTLCSVEEAGHLFRNYGQPEVSR